VPKLTLTSNLKLTDINKTIYVDKLGFCGSNALGLYMEGGYLLYIVTFLVKDSETSRRIS
jgi:hypothetical protein